MSRDGLSINPLRIILSFLSLFHLALATANAAYSTDEASYDPKDIIRRDVAVIGGGSTGTYTALRLKDHDKSIVIVEPKNHIGGHAETYFTPSGYAVNTGVVVFAQIKTVTDYFARFGVPLQKFDGSGAVGSTTLVDFATGEKVTNVTAASPSAFVAALKKYSVQLEKYPALANSFNLTYPVDEDLLMPFGDFVAKYGLGDMMGPVFASNQGFVPLLNISTLYMLKYLNADQVNSFENGYLTTTHHDTQELYRGALRELGSDVLLNSTVLAMRRPSSYSSSKEPVRVLVQTPQGRKLLVARKLVSTAPPMPSVLKNYDLSAEERALFGQFRANGYYTGVLNNTGLPANTSLSATGPGRPFDVPRLPGPYGFSYNAGAGVTQVYYATPDVVSADAAKRDILANLQRYKAANGLTSPAGAPPPDWLAFSSHAPFNLEVSNDAIRAGFYRRLFALQGRRATFFNGAAWQTQDSSVLWRFTDEYVLPILLASL